MKPASILIHFPQTQDVINHLNDLGLKYKETVDEYDVIVDDVPYEMFDGTYQEPIEEL